MPPLEKFNNFEFLGEVYLGVEPEVIAEIEATMQETRTFEEVHFGEPREEILLEPEDSEELEVEEQQQQPEEAPANPPLLIFLLVSLMMRATT